MYIYRNSSLLHHPQQWLKEHDRLNSEALVEENI